MKVTDRNNTKRMLREIDKLMNSALEIGIFGESGSEILLRANVNEFGAPSVNVPERSFIRAGFDRHRESFRQEMIAFIPGVVFGRVTADEALRSLGDSFVSKIQKFTTDLKTPPNAVSTIKQKGSSNPLIDSGDMRDSITYRVVTRIV